MSMLYYFFTLKEAEANRVLFEGCKVEKAGERDISWAACVGADR
jgi:hypothetical protein